MPEGVEIPVFADQTVQTKVPAAPAEGDKPAQDTGDQAPPAKPEAKPGEVKEEVTPEQAAKRDGRRFERKLDKAYRERAEARARAEFSERQLAEERAKNAPKAPEGKPTLEQYEYDPEKYAQASFEDGKSQATKEIETKQRTDAGNRERQRLISGWEAKVEKVEDKYEDFPHEFSRLVPDTPFFAAIMDAENGAEIVYYLHKNPAEDQRLARLPPWSQGREIGKLEAKLLAEPVKPKVPSKAPAPITPLTGTAPVTSGESLATDDDKTWMLKRQKQVHGRR